MHWNMVPGRPTAVGAIKKEVEAQAAKLEKEDESASYARYHASPSKKQMVSRDWL